MGVFLSIRALHEQGQSKKAIARRLGIDVRTVRKYLKRIDGGDEAPRRVVVRGKLDPFQSQIEEKVEAGLSATQIYQDLCKDRRFDVSYETVKRLVRVLRPKEPQVYCRLQFQPGEEAQIDFGDVSPTAVI